MIRLRVAFPAGNLDWTWIFDFVALYYDVFVSFWQLVLDDL